MRIVKPIVFKTYGFSRDSVATYYDESGILQTAAIDVLRLGYDPTTLEFLGPIIENSATNMILYSDDFSDAQWQVTDSPTRTYDAAISPDGTMNATLFGGNGSIRQTFSEFAGDGVFSIFVKPVSTSPFPAATSVVLSLGTGTGIQMFYNFYSDIEPTMQGSWGLPLGGIQKLPNGWYRIYIAKAGISSPSTIFSRAATHQFYASKAQFESGLTPTSYIETDSSVATREADEQSEPPVLVLSNIEEDDHADWEDDVEYVAGDQRIVRGDYHKVYESVSTNTNKFPPENPADWIDQGATNRWRMFDMEVGPEKQTVSDDSNNLIDVLVGVDEPVNSVVLLNMDGSNVRVIMRDESAAEVYNYYRDLLGSSYESSWWAWFLGSRSRSSTLVLTDLPPYRPSTIQVILDGGDAPAKLGKMIVGYGEEIGCARYGTSVGIVDFSAKGRDAFGNNFVIERRYIDRAEFDVQILTNRVDEVKALLAGVRATPVVYIGDVNFSSTVLYGFYKDFSIIISGPKRSDVSIQVESI